MTCEKSNSCLRYSVCFHYLASTHQDETHTLRRYQSMSQPTEGPGLRLIFLPSSILSWTPRLVGVCPDAGDVHLQTCLCRINNACVESELSYTQYVMWLLHCRPTTNWPCGLRSLCAPYFCFAWVKETHASPSRVQDMLLFKMAHGHYWVV